MDWKLTSDWVLASAGIAALLLTLLQIRENGRLARMGESWRLWSEYLKLGFDNPWFGSTPLLLRRAGQKSFRAFWNIDNEQLSAENIELREKYAWFLTALLNAAEGLATGPRASLWKTTLIGQLGDHRIALQEIWRDGDAWGKEFDPALDRLVSQVLREGHKHAQS